MSRGTWSSAHFGAEMACEPRFGEDRIGSLPVPPTVRCLSAQRVSAEPAWRLLRSLVRLRRDGLAPRSPDCPFVCPPIWPPWSPVRRLRRSLEGL